MKHKVTNDILLLVIKFAKLDNKKVNEGSKNTNYKMINITRKGLHSHTSQKSY